MRILLITWNYPPKLGGMETMMYQLVSHLRTREEVHVLGPYDEAESVEEATWRPRRDGLAWFFVSAWSACLRVLRSQDYGAIIAGSALLMPIAYAFGRVFRLAMIVNVYGLDLIYSHPLYQLMLELLLKRFDRVFAISEASKREALKRGALPDDVSIVHPGLDFSEFEAKPDQRSLKQRYGFAERRVLLSVGRLTRRKGIPEFVRYALPTIVAACPDAAFVVVGGNPTQSLTHTDDVRAEIQAAVEGRQLGAHVRLLGRVERNVLVELYHACDVFVLPAIHVAGDMEGFGIVLIEASAAGKPVVSTRLGGIPDAVVDGKSGILVEAEHWHELSDAVLTLLTDESLRQEMGQFGRERVRSEFDWPVIAARYGEQLRVVLGQHRE